MERGNTFLSRTILLNSHTLYNANIGKWTGSCCKQSLSTSYSASTCGRMCRVFLVVPYAFHNSKIHTIAILTGQLVSAWLPSFSPPPNVFSSSANEIKHKRISCVQWWRGGTLSLVEEYSLRATHFTMPTLANGLAVVVSSP